MSERISSFFVPDDSRRESSNGSHEGIILNTLDNPAILKTNNGIIVCGTDEGYRPKRNRNEDALVVDTHLNAFAVIDGIGGGGKGQENAQALAGVVADYFQNGESDFEMMQRDAHEKMQQMGLGEFKGGACYLAAIINQQGELIIGHAGDVKLIILRDGKISFTTTEERKTGKEKHVVTNFVSGYRQGDTTSYKVPLKNGDRIIAASDGLWDSINDSDVAELAQGMGAVHAMRVLADESYRRMEAGIGKPDNRTILIYDFIE